MVGWVAWGMGTGVVDQQGWRKGPWTPEEDNLLTEYVTQHGEGRWSSVSRSAGTYKYKYNLYRMYWYKSICFRISFSNM